MAAPDTGDGPAAADEVCIEEDVADDRRNAVVGADLAAWLVEDLLPPPLRVAGLGSGETTVLLDGVAVGDVVVEETEPGIFVATAFTYCVPTGVDLSRTDLARTLDGTWRLATSEPELALPDDARMELVITRDRFGGHAVCNQYHARPAAGPGGALRLSRVFFDEAGCGPGEPTYWGMLQTADAWALQDGMLVISGPDGVLRYARGDG